MLRVAFVMLAACELVPAPKQQPAPVVPLAAEPAPADATELVPPTAQTCEEIGKHVAAVMIAAAKDPAVLSILEQERDATAKKTAENCTAQKWTKAKLECYAQARAPADVKACDQRFPSA